MWYRSGGGVGGGGDGGGGGIYIKCDIVALVVMLAVMKRVMEERSGQRR